MAWRWLKGAPVSRQWIDFRAISPALPRSVVGSEDAKFCSHHGIDWDALREVIDDAEDGEVSRGGSTITQQVAKNLFLWPGRSAIRKGLEIPLAMWIDLMLPKQRISKSISQYRRPGAESGPVRGRGGGDLRPAAPPPLCRHAKPRCWRRSCSIRSGAVAPKKPRPRRQRRLAGTYTAPGAGLTSQWITALGWNENRLF